MGSQCASRPADTSDASLAGMGTPLASSTAPGASIFHQRIRSGNAPVRPRADRATGCGRVGAGSTYVHTGQPLRWNNYHGQIWRAEAGLTLVGNQLFVPVSASEGGDTMFSVVSSRAKPAP